MNHDDFLYINLWTDRDQAIEATPFKRADDALEEIGAEYPNLRYIGTVVVERDGARAPEDWSQDARRYREAATEDWLAELRERQAYRQKIV